MSYGSTRYSRGAETAVPPRDLEAAAFAFVNRSLEDAKESHDRTVALGRNHRLWALLLADIGLSSNALPPILKQDLVSIGSWSMSYSIIAMGRDIPLQPLVDINLDMIEALKPNEPSQACLDVLPSAIQMNLSRAI